MKKLFRTCTALLMAMCLVLGLGAGVAASAAETEDLTKQDLVDWAKDVLAQMSAVEVREELTAVNLEKLIREVVALTEEKVADLEAFLAEKEAEVDEVTGELEVEITGAKAKLKEAKQICADLENAHPGAKEAAVKFLKAMGKAVNPSDDVLEAMDHAIAEIEDVIAKAKETETVTIPHAKQAIDKLQAAIKAAKKAAKKLAPYAETAVEESQPVLDAMFAVYDAMKVLVGEGANAAALELQSALHEMASSTVDYVEAVTGKRSERLDAIASKAKAELDQMYRDATQAELDCVELSKVVALGDKNVYGTAADLVGSMTQNFMGEGNYTFVNATKPGQTAAELRANLSKYAADLEGATVITLSFGTNAFSKYAFDKVTNNSDCNWGMYIGEGNAAKIEAAKAELGAKLQARGVKNIAPVVRMAESYAFAYMQHILSYYPLVRDIHAMNPDAHVVMVGMHNPLEGFATEVGGVEIPLGDFMRYLADISNIYSLSYAMLSENKLYVDAFEIEVGNEGAYYEHVPTQKGHAEIAQNIWDALGVHDHNWVEDEDAKTSVKEGDKTITTTWEECTICGARRSTTNVKTGDMIGVVLVTLAVSGLGISVLKRREN